MIALALVMTWQQLAACERVTAQLERLSHVQQYKAATSDQKAAERAVRAYRQGVRARDVASVCVAAVVGESN